MVGIVLLFWGCSTSEENRELVQETVEELSNWEIILNNKSKQDDIKVEEVSTDFYREHIEPLNLLVNNPDCDWEGQSLPKWPTERYTINENVDLYKIFCTNGAYNSVSMFVLHDKKPDYSRTEQFYQIGFSSPEVIDNDSNEAILLGMGSSRLLVNAIFNPEKNYLYELSLGSGMGDSFRINIWHWHEDQFLLMESWSDPTSDGQANPILSYSVEGAEKIKIEILTEEQK